MKTVKISIRYGLLLASVAFICAVLSTSIYFLTKDTIESEINKQKQDLLLQVVPQTYFDNALIEYCYEPESSILKDNRIQEICIATQTGKKTAYAIETIAPDGYSGNIRLLVGMTPEGEILGVRVLEHHETPGLGDKIETRFSNWILSFNNQQITPDNLSEWAVKKDGGKFDQFSGATITPRAIVNQVKTATLAMLDEINKEKAE
ncbi:electron transport complex subunit RsxG [Pasteurella dagmatis]|uniref:Ion-translocating oxidoreductase complex subunit G n=1 Tax=Pasteurella dagmatis ATCC 43325 TaxID=667128 RepID=C9PQK5_9PAST|nr:electron transport complex subunit RsxG [Pasteurella dagmatis]EEX50127.1 electron transport complex, RnfABCDGE type, G subunit [Pasteurella dagmatis ATCC 43325]SNV57657.1 electron transport complex protein RnfG [Pasteurella dagmatis]